MKRLILIVWMAGLLIPAGLMAQKVYEDSGMAVLDLTEAAGMPADARTDAAKYTLFTPSATVLGTNNDNNGSINATVYKMLEVAKHDLTGSGTIGSGGGTFTWVNAFTYCKALGAGWRLPTQRELMLMYVFRTALEGIFSTVSVSGTAFSSAYYWSATEGNATYAWFVYFSNGITYNGTKTTSYRARCVREIP